MPVGSGASLRHANRRIQKKGRSVRLRTQAARVWGGSVRASRTAFAQTPLQEEPDEEVPELAGVGEPHAVPGEVSGPTPLQGLGPHDQRLSGEVATWSN
jgi:hypothetical protein